MLGKLLKYEWRATARVLLPLYGIFLVASLLLNIAIRFSFSLISGLIGLAYFGVGVACVVMTLILLIQRFDGNLLRGEGYLMFTLPVSVAKLILSKLIIALFWGIIGGVIGGIGGLFTIISKDILEVLPQAWNSSGPRCGRRRRNIICCSCWPWSIASSPLPASFCRSMPRWPSGKCRRWRSTAAWRVWPPLF